MRATYRRRVLTVLVIFMTMVSTLGSGSLAFAQDASPVAPEPTSTVAPTAVPTEEVQSEAAPGKVDLTIYAWLCPADDYGPLVTEFFDNIADAPDRTAEGCSRYLNNLFGSASVILYDANEVGIATTTLDATGTIVFQDLTPGSYFVAFQGENSLIPVTLLANTTPLIDALAPNPIDPDEDISLSASYMTCESADLAGTYGFEVDSLLFGLASTITCQPGPLATDDETTLSLVGETTVGPIVVEDSLTGFPSVPVGTYTINVSVGGTEVAVSDPYDFTNVNAISGIQVIHYVAPGTVPTPVVVDGTNGGVDVSTYYCQDPSRVGEVDFFVGVLDAPFGGVDTSVTNCQIGFGNNGSFTLINTDTDEIYQQEPSPFGISPFRDLPDGTYKLQITGGASSEPFAVSGDDIVPIQVHIYNDDTLVANLIVQTLICLDNDRIGEADFTMLDFTANDAAKTANCVLNYFGDFLYFDLTNTETGIVYSNVAVAQGLGFISVPPGTYVIETEEGNVSEPFELTATTDTFSGTAILITRYVGDDDFPTIPESDYASLYLGTARCTTTDQDATNWYLIVNYNEVQPGAAEPVSNCSTGAIPPLSFEVIPQDAEANAAAPGTPIPLVIEDGYYTLPFDPQNPIPAGMFTIHEINTDTTSEPVYLGEDTSGTFFLMSIIQPEPTPTTEPGVTPTTEPGVTPTVTTAPTVPSGATPIATDPAKPGTGVTALPNTGQGTSSDNGSWSILILGAASLLLVAAAGSAIRRRTR